MFHYVSYLASWQKKYAHEGPGAHFTNNFSIIIKTWNGCNVKVILVLPNVENDMITQLSCHVQNFIATTSLKLGWEQNDPLNLNYDGKFFHEMGPRSFPRASNTLCYVTVYPVITRHRYMTIMRILSDYRCVRQRNNLSVQNYKAVTSRIMAPGSAEILVKFYDDYVYVYK